MRKISRMILKKQSIRGQKSRDTLQRCLPCLVLEAHSIIINRNSIMVGVMEIVRTVLRIMATVTEDGITGIITTTAASLAATKVYK